MLFEEFNLLDPDAAQPGNDIPESLTPDEMLELAEKAKAELMGDLEDFLARFREEGYEKVWLDIDGDGLPEEVFRLDMDGDGVADKLFTLRDLDMDGNADSIQMIMKIDADQDGMFDGYAVGDADANGDIDGIISVMADLDGDGLLEAESTFLFVDDKVGVLAGEDPVSWAPAYKSFDPAHANSNAIVGNPADCLDNWQLQETDYSCTIVAQMAEIEERLGIDLQEEDMRQLAFEKGWVSEENGGAQEDVGKLMEYMGIPVERSFGNDLLDVRACLERGVHPLVAVDGEELWQGYNEELVVPGRDANHIVQVIGIDETDPENPMVIINDSGVPNGCGAMVSADAFVNAWDYEGFMVAAL